MLKELAASLGAAAATEKLIDADIAELLAESLENLADCMDGLTQILEAYASEEESNED